MAAEIEPAAKDRLREYNGGMVLRRIPHAVYEPLAHVFWSPTYRRDVWQGEVQQRVRERFVDIAAQYDISVSARAIFVRPHVSRGDCGVETCGKMAMWLVQSGTRARQR